jgi:hypothetical protein
MPDKEGVGNGNYRWFVLGGDRGGADERGHPLESFSAALS